jgi:hypothetical protein
MFHLDKSNNYYEHSYRGRKNFWQTTKISDDDIDAEQDGVEYHKYLLSLFINSYSQKHIRRACYVHDITTCTYIYGYTN